MFIDEQLLIFKNKIEEAIKSGGTSGKESIIRSSDLINLIHDAVKFEFISFGINPNNIFPHFKKSKPEIKLAGFLKQKKQDICIIPSGIEKKKTPITWGPLAFQNKEDKYGYDFSTNTLVINVRSQMSSLSKNADTLFERTYAEAHNLHMRYPEIVLGEVYLIPVNEYDNELVKQNKVGFKKNQTDLERYISFFNSINNRKLRDDSYKYERCALLIVDFNKTKPKLFKNSEELKYTKLISDSFNIEYAELGFESFAKDILEVYAERYNINNIM